MLHGLNRGPQRAIAVIAALCLAEIASSASAQNPLGVYAPINLSNSLPYRIELREHSLGDIDLPTLHSFAVGEFDGKWLMISGRTNGLHGFAGGFFPDGNFPPQSQNRDVWVLDIANNQSWHRSLDDATSGLSEDQIVALATTNNQFYHKGNTLYITGGYGVKSNGTNFGTFDTLSAIDMPGLGEWVMDGTGSAADHIRQINNPVFKVTGGAMHEIAGRTHLVFGQDFDGVYTPFSNGAYTNQVRSFDIIDDGNMLAVQDITSTTPDSNYRRRDLNVVPTLRPDGVGGHEEGLVALSGVFTPADDPWTVPVEIDANGNPSMDDPNNPATFQQGMNNYHSSKLGLFSQTSGEMHEVLFGGISLQYLDPVTQMIKTDTQLPFVNDITSVVIAPDGTYSQHHLGFFPELFDTQNRRLRLGTNSEFMLADDAPKFDNGVIDFDALAAGENSLGFIYGGIIANAPHVRSNPEGLSSASNHIFEVVLIRVPEPSSLVMAALFGILGVFSWRHR